MLQQHSNATHQRYIVMVLLFFHTVNTYMDRVCISAAAGDIKRDLAISDQEMGYLFAVFALGYALFQIPAGWMADAFGSRKALAIVVAAWSTFTMLSGAARNWGAMLVIRFLFGVGEAGAFPGATRALYNWLPPGERGIAQGIFHSGARVGAALSLLFMPWLVVAIGWRWTFVLNGAVGIVWAAIWWVWFRDRPRDHRGVNCEELRQIGEEDFETSAEATTTPFVAIVTSLNMALAMLQYAASNVTFFLSFTWLLPYLQTQWGHEAGNYAPLPLLFGTLAHWISGSLVTWLHRRGLPVGSRRLPAVAGFLLGAAGLLLCTRVAPTDPLPFVLAFSVAVFGVEMTIAPSWSFCMDIGGPKSGAVSASMNMVGNLGAALGAMLFPYFVHHVSLPWLAEKTGSASSFFVFAAAINVLGGLCWFAMNPQRTPAKTVSVRQLAGRFAFAGSVFVAAVAVLVYYQFFYGK